MFSVSSKLDYTVSAKPLDAELFANEKILSSEGIEKHWTDAEERKLVLKLDFTILIFLMLSFFSLQLDRSNISNVLTAGITKDINTSTDQIKAGNQLQLAAICVMEIPSNIIIQKIGCLPWLLTQSVLWGLVAIFQSFINDKKSYYATRWLLGMFEAGFIPGSIYFLSKFYRRNEMSTRTTIFYFGNYFAAAVGNLIAAGILSMGKVNGWPAWRYLFLIEGCITIFAAILLFIFVSSSPENPVPIHKMFCFFTEHEKKIMADRIRYYDYSPGEEITDDPITFKNVLKSICLWRNWLHCLMNFLQLSPYGGLQLFSPLIIKTLGFSTVRANALVSIGPFGLCLLSYVVSKLSDYFKIRGPFIFISLIYSIVFAGVLKSMTIGKTDKWVLFAMITLINAGTGTPQSLNNSWLAINSKSSMDRAVGLAMCVIGANLGGITGQSFFSAKDAPRYSRAFLCILCFYGVSIAWCIGIMVIYYVLNKRSAKNIDRIVENIEKNKNNDSNSLEPITNGTMEGEKSWTYQI